MRPKDPPCPMEGSCDTVLPAKGGILPCRTSTCINPSLEAAPPSTSPESSNNADSAPRSAFDPVLLAAITLYLAAQTAHVWLVKAQDGVTAASCDGCPTGENFDSPMLQAFFGDVGELLTLPVFLLAEHCYSRHLGLRHGSAFLWNSIERVLGAGHRAVGVVCDAPAAERKEAEYRGCTHCEVWRQPVVAGLVLRAGELAPTVGNTTKVPAHLIRDPPKPRVPFYYWCVSAALGLAAAVFQNMALEVMDMATQTMLSGFVIPLVAGLSWLALRKRLLGVPHLLGVALVLTGVALVGALPALAPLAQNRRQPQSVDGLTYTHMDVELDVSPNWCVGLLLTGMSVLCLALNTIAHEYLLTYHDCNPLEVIALDSAWTVGLSLGMLPLAAILQLEDIRGGLYQISHSPRLSGMVAAYSLVHIPAQAMVYVIISRSGALTMAMVQQCQTCVLWVVDVLFAGALFIPLQLAAYMLIAAGTLVYTYVLPVRSWMRLEPPIETVIQEEEEEIRRMLLSRYLRGYGGSWFQRANSVGKERGSSC